MRRHTYRLLSLVLALGVIAACGKKPPDTPPPPPPAAPPIVRNNPPPAPPPPPPQQPAPRPVAPPTPTEAELFARLSLDELNAQNPLGDVLFAFDSADLSDAARTALQRNADWLRKWGSTRVMVEGHADARGTTEYNLALGERRASAVRDYLVSLGLATARLSIVAKGEEQPVCSEETDDCWAKNRRGHFIVIQK